MTYEPRVGDLVRAQYPSGVMTVTGFDEDSVPLVRPHFGAEYRLPPSALTPLRPDAPGQRVRAVHHGGGKFLVGVTRGVSPEPLSDRIALYVEWDWDGGNWWQRDRLIRIADQAPAAPVAKTCAPPEAPPTEDARKESGYQTAPAAINQGPACQHCGSGIVAGLLRDTCPRGCDLALRAKEPEPATVLPYPWRGESCWLAEGGGHFCVHPTRDGAIAAWREAVRR